MKAAFVIGAAVLALSTQANAQTYSVQLSGSGSSALYLALGQAAASSTTGALCLWTNPSSVSVQASDTSTGSTLNDSGNSWVAWSPSAASGHSCSTYVSTDTVDIYAYLQVDSVVGNRCLFNAVNFATPECSITNYPVNNTTGTATGNRIYPSAGTCGNTSTSPGECSLPGAVATALNTFGTNNGVNYAGTDIRPEDAEFAVTRATTGCGTQIGSSSYYGLGYSNGGNIDSYFSGSVFHVIEFTLPTTGSGGSIANNYTVVPVGASPILFVANGSGFPSGYSISSATVAKFLDGTYSYTGQLSSSPSATGSAVTVVIREPLSGTYNTTEYTVPNTINNSSTYSLNGNITGNYTSQDVGEPTVQPASQQNCPGNASFLAGSTSNPMHIVTASGGERDRAIGTGQELSEVISLTAASGTDTFGYGFWSVPNFAGFTSSAAPNAHYLAVDGYDPLTCGGTYSFGGSILTCPSFSGTIPTTAAQIATVDMHTVANGNYPAWSLLRLVTAGSSSTGAATAAANLSSAAQNFVAPGTVPNFVALASMKAVRSHFTPPAGLTGSSYPATNTNGDTQLFDMGTTYGNCYGLPESGGDVGGLIISLAADDNYCANIETDGLGNGVLTERY